MNIVAIETARPLIPTGNISVKTSHETKEENKMNKFPVLFELNMKHIVKCCKEIQHLSIFVRQSYEQGYVDIVYISVPDQVGTLRQVGTKKISKGGWTILELFEPHRNHYLSFRSQSDQERVFTRGRN